jgi:pyruvate, water dikinase
VEWAKDGETGETFILQARPETVQSQKRSGGLMSYRLEETGPVIVEGQSIGDAIARGPACVIESAAEIDRFRDGSILVTEMTDPDWGPIMKRAAGIVTDAGGRTCHAAIVSRELGIPAIVGTSEATTRIRDGQPITLSCAEGEHGVVYEGELEFVSEEIDLDDLPETKTRIMLNIASPEAAFRWWRLPARGVGLARIEFLVGDVIQVHPMALLHPERVDSKDERKRIGELTAGYEDPAEYFVDLLARGIAKIAASQFPHPAIVRLSDFKTNEYRDLLGGKAFEKREANPMLGLRGASRYYSERYREAFRLECRAVRRAREEIGLENIKVMVPFCRTLEEADRVLEILAEEGLESGVMGLELYLMCEIPSNVVLASEFAKRFHGFSIGSNDLTQLVLGVDRDSQELAKLFDERDEAVKRLIAETIERAHEAGVTVGICGQAPSDYPDFAEFLVQQGIDSISLNPDSVAKVIPKVAAAEARIAATGAGGSATRSE